MPTYTGIALAVILGAFAIVAGGMDDAPGAQLIGVVLIVGAVAYGVRAMRRRTAP